MIASVDEERAEMDAVLQSGIFLRAPNLESFFRYVCELHLRGQAQQLKEYSIAVEALGRAPHFDQKKDSIVRVEAHRLRKRLTDYYAGPGADHKIHIHIPRGSYAPRFVSPSPNPTPDPEPPVTALDPLPPGEPPVQPIPATPRQFPVRLLWVAGLLLLATAAFGLVRWRISGANQNSELGNEVWRDSGEVVPAEFRILAGYHGQPIRDLQGRDWHADAYYTGGRSRLLPRQLTVQGLPGSSFVKTARTGQFHYDIPVGQGSYEVHLYFAETEYGVGNPKGGGDGSRLFRLSINGSTQIEIFDVHAQAGAPNRLFVRVFKDIFRAADGKIHIAFDPLSGMAILNAIEILPSAAGRIRPIRIVAQDHSITDSDGQIWYADEYVIGGTLVSRPNALVHDPNFALYQGERYGNFSYHIPLAPGKYRLILYFAETWFGTPSAQISSQEHRRLFDIYANGLALIRAFDVLREAGAPNRGIEKVFEGLEPNAQGELALQFVPLSNYAEVNAIEVVESE